MIKHFALSQHISAESAMQKVGYTYHCGQDGRPCYHRQLNDPPFPRFHAYAMEKNGHMEIDLHIDAHDVVDHQSNHDQSWAYEGGRIEQEMQRIRDVLEGRPTAKVAGTERLKKNSKPARTPKNLIDLLLD